MFGFSPKPALHQTDITVLLDRSGSMETIRAETIAGFETFVDKQRELQGDCRLTLCQFDTVYETVYRSRRIQRVPPLDLRPRGATALLDAIGHCLADTDRRLSRWTLDATPAQVIFVIITDGLENSSREFSRSQILRLIEHHTNKLEWQFVYLGANQDAIREAERIGIAPAAAMNYRADTTGVNHAWCATGEAVARHRRAGGRQVRGDYFTPSEREG